MLESWEQKMMVKSGACNFLLQKRTVHIKFLNKQIKTILLKINVVFTALSLKPYGAELLIVDKTE